MKNYPFTFDSDRPLAVLGVAGRLTHRTTKPGAEGGAVWTRQRWISETRPCPAAWGYGPNAEIRAEIRFDDECGNGRNTFSITGEVTTPQSRRRGDVEACGCIHDEIAEAFPELAGLIRWHLTSSDGPMHYVANAAYQAGERDHWGKRAGEPTHFADMIRFGGVPALHPLKNGKLVAFLREIAEYDREGQRAALVPIAVAHADRPGESYRFAPKYQFAGQMPLKWHECAFDSEGEAERFAASFLDHSPELVRVPTAWSEGKPRDLDAARRVAVWPEATDAELCQPRADLEKALLARLPALMAAFRADMEAAGFVWAPSEFRASI